MLINFKNNRIFWFILALLFLLCSADIVATLLKYLPYLISFILGCILCVAATGCDFIAPNVSKAQTERKQLESSEAEVEQLRRIADSLEILTKEQD